MFPDLDKFALKTPKKIPFFEEEFPVVTIPSELKAIKDQARNLNQEPYWWEEDDFNSLLPTPLFLFLKHLCSFLMKYDQWLVEPLEVIALLVATVEGDLHKLKHHCETLELAIGRPLALEGNTFPDVWSALEFVTGEGHLQRVLLICHRLWQPSKAAYPSCPLTSNHIRI